MARGRRVADVPETESADLGAQEEQQQERGLPVFIKFTAREAPWSPGDAIWVPALEAAKFVKHGVAVYAES